MNQKTFLSGTPGLSLTVSRPPHPPSTHPDAEVFFFPPQRPIIGHCPIHVVFVAVSFCFCVRSVSAIRKLLKIGTCPTSIGTTSVLSKFLTHFFRKISPQTVSRYRERVSAYLHQVDRKLILKKSSTAFGATLKFDATPVHLDEHGKSKRAEIVCRVVRFSGVTEDGADWDFSPLPIYNVPPNSKSSGLFCSLDLEALRCDQFAAVLNYLHTISDRCPANIGVISIVSWEIFPSSIPPSSIFPSLSLLFFSRCFLLVFHSLRIFFCLSLSPLFPGPRC